MRKLLTHCVIFECLSMFVFAPIVHATNFNPQLILSDADLTAAQTMTVQDVQNFLNAQQSGIRSMQFIDEDGTLRTAAEIIISTANEDQINPRYILAVLQKEQSLITSQNPTQKQLDWATGYGVCDACSLSDPSIQKFKGFAIQVRRSSGIMRYYYDNLQANWIKRSGQQYLIDNQLITPLSNATGFLYTYTPHINGNKNLWQLWSQWFTKFYPDGSLVKADGEATVYLIQNGKRRPFLTRAAFLSRYNPDSIITVQPTDLSAYAQDAGISLPNYSLVRTPNDMIYLLIDDEKHPIAGSAVLKNLGYNPQEIDDVTDADVAEYTNGTFITAASIYPLGAVVQEKKSKQLYYIKNGIRYIIPSADIAKNNFPSKKIITLDLKQLAKFDFDPTKVVTFKDGTLLTTKGSPYTYVVSNGMLRLIPSDTVFNNLGYQKKNVIVTSEQSLVTIPMGDPLQDVVSKTQIAARTGV
ncbi:MAG: hypothetical protein NT003_01440 [Candidatus Magasanikbacteria bacterium]|nr:hypothetical protein [Candidatus Magasanikbacteria bacterium]